MHCSKFNCIFIAIIIIGMLSACAPTEYFPDDGEWYCEELGIQLDFGGNGHCFMLINGEEMECANGSDRGSDYLSVGCQEPYCEYCYLGEEVFGAVFVMRDEEKLIVRDANSGKEYVFMRVS